VWGRERSYSKVSEFIDPDRGDKVKSGIGLSYRHARIHGLADQNDKSMPESTLTPSQRFMNSATDVVRV
jgi:hypothetical protein